MKTVLSALVALSVIAGVAGGAVAMDAKEFYERVDRRSLLIGRRTQKPQPISFSKRRMIMKTVLSALVALSVIASVAGTANACS